MHTTSHAKEPLNANIAHCDQTAYHNKPSLNPIRTRTGLLGNLLGENTAEQSSHRGKLGLVVEGDLKKQTRKHEGIQNETAWDRIVFGLLTTLAMEGTRDTTCAQDAGFAFIVHNTSSKKMRSALTIDLQLHHSHTGPVKKEKSKRKPQNAKAGIEPCG